jgi:Amidases related to nicotinamidase
MCTAMIRFSGRTTACRARRRCPASADGLAPHLGHHPQGNGGEVRFYSGFRNNWNAEGERPSTGLEGYLRERGIETVLVCGLARDVCVKWTAEDAAAAGFRTLFLWDLTRPVEPDADDDVRHDLESAGVEIVSSDDLPG